ncbi:hypothetical protein VTK73DRAFT_4960 [Phialemonium thermophilum]|uniref:Uncharacterized protein n=1 Tax=Phialemonium thermophilum TaxID=223376 RepID=A0ABR3V4H8_9PEZI
MSESSPATRRRRIWRASMEAALLRVPSGAFWCTLVHQDAEGGGGRVGGRGLGLRLHRVSHEHLQEGGPGRGGELLVRVAEDLLQDAHDARGQELGAGDALEHVGVEVRGQAGEEVDAGLAGQVAARAAVEIEGLDLAGERGQLAEDLGGLLAHLLVVLLRLVLLQEPPGHVGDLGLRGRREAAPRRSVDGHGGTRRAAAGRRGGALLVVTTTDVAVFVGVLVIAILAAVVVVIVVVVVVVVLVLLVGRMGRMAIVADMFIVVVVVVAVRVRVRVVVVVLLLATHGRMPTILVIARIVRFDMQRDRSPTCRRGGCGRLRVFFLFDGELGDLGDDALAVELVPVDVVQTAHQELGGAQGVQDEGRVVPLGEDGGQEGGVGHGAEGLDEDVLVQVRQHLELGEQDLLADGQVDGAGEGVGQGARRASRWTSSSADHRRRRRHYHHHHHYPATEG